MENSRGVIRDEERDPGPGPGGGERGQTRILVPKGRRRSNRCRLRDRGRLARLRGAAARHGGDVPPRLAGWVFTPAPRRICWNASTSASLGVRAIPETLVVADEVHVGPQCPGQAPPVQRVARAIVHPPSRMYSSVISRPSCRTTGGTLSRSAMLVYSAHGISSRARRWGVEGERERDREVALRATAARSPRAGRPSRW